MGNSVQKQRLFLAVLVDERHEQLIGAPYPRKGHSRPDIVQNQQQTVGQAHGFIKTRLLRIVVQLLGQRMLAIGVCTDPVKGAPKAQLPHSAVATDASHKIS